MEVGIILFKCYNEVVSYFVIFTSEVEFEVLLD